MDIEIISGFLGAGKTTFLNKYLSCLSGKTAVIENEFGDIGIDGGWIQTGVPVTEIVAGCICCSLSMDFRKGIQDIYMNYHPDRILIEPSGVGLLSDVLKACEKAVLDNMDKIVIKRKITLVDASSFEGYAEDFGSFYLDQIKHAGIIFLSNIEGLGPQQMQLLIRQIESVNPNAYLYAEDWREIDSDTFLDVLSMPEDYVLENNEEVRDESRSDKIFTSLSIRNIGGKTKDDMQDLGRRLQSGEYGQVLRGKGLLQTKDKTIVKLDITSNRCNVESFQDMEVEEKMLNVVVLIGCGLKKNELLKLFC